MNPRNTLAFWQNFARACGPAIFAFAKSGALRKAVVMRFEGSNPAFGMFDCYPIPSNWSGPVWVRPLFLSPAQQVASLGRGTQKFQFKSAENAVESALITTNQRGTSICIKHLSFLPFARLLCLAVFAPIPQPLVQASGQFRAWPLARLQTTTWPNRPWLAGLRACSRAMRAFAADLAAQTEPTSNKASCGVSAAGLLQFHACASGPSPAYRGESYV
jgi:hypothetical protein